MMRKFLVATTVLLTPTLAYPCPPGFLCYENLYGDSSLVRREEIAAFSTGLGRELGEGESLGKEDEGKVGYIYLKGGGDTPLRVRNYKQVAEQIKQEETLCVPIFKDDSPTRFEWRSFVSK